MPDSRKLAQEAAEHVLRPRTPPAKDQWGHTALDGCHPPQLPTSGLRCSYSGRSRLYRSTFVNQPAEGEPGPESLKPSAAIYRTFFHLPKNQSDLFRLKVTRRQLEFCSAQEGRRSFLTTRPSPAASLCSSLTGHAGPLSTLHRATWFSSVLAPLFPPAWRTTSSCQPPLIWKFLSCFLMFRALTF